MDKRVFHDPNELATVNHDLVYRFLAARSLDADEYYDIVIFGYLRAVLRYCTEEKLQQYKFSTIAWRCMRTDLANHYRSLKRQKRAVSEISLDTDPSLRNIPSVNSAMMQLEMDLLLADLTTVLCKAEMDIIRMRIEGYSCNEIAKALHYSPMNVVGTLIEISPAVKQLCNK